LNMLLALLEDELDWLCCWYYWRMNLIEYVAGTIGG